MVNLAQGELFQALMDGCQRYTESILYLGGQNPYRLSLNGASVTVFLSNVHSARRVDQDEFRIQCPGSLPSELGSRRNGGDIVCVLGYSGDIDIFSAWDPERFLKRNTSTNRFSLYTRMSKISQARQHGFAKYDDSQGQVVLQFRSEFLGLYIENLTLMHRATNRNLDRIAEIFGETSLGSRFARPLTVARRRIKATHTHFARSPRFRSAVLTAYEFSCAMCRVQLDLIEAAHIVPHAHEHGTDAIHNGLALCSLHHKSYDSGLVYFDSDYCVHINRDRVNYLRKTNRVEGLSRFKRLLRRRIHLPNDTNLHPSSVNIELGNSVRGIGVGLQE